MLRRWWATRRHGRTTRPDPDLLEGELPNELVARNETVSRRVNEAIEQGRTSRDGLSGFVCECGQLDCNSILEPSLGEYEALRSHPRQFVIVPGHGADFDREVSRTARYLIVVKQGPGGTIAELTDPRAAGN